jgi:hypothetical protein
LLGELPRTFTDADLKCRSILPIASRKGGGPVAATRMGGRRGPDDLEAAPVTQSWLAVSEDPDAMATGGYWYHQRRRDAHPAASDARFQDELIDCCWSLSGVRLAG